MGRILIAEHEPRISAFVDAGLRANGYATAVAADGPLVASMLREHTFDLVILEFQLPGKDGHDILQELRRRGDTLPVIILTARDDVDDTIAGLDAGADDYVTKPFRFEELLARIRVRLRYRGGLEASVLRAGSLTLDLHTRRATTGDRVAILTTRECSLVETLMRHAGQVVSRRQLLDHVWGLHFDPGSNVVDVYVRYVRQKLGHGVIETARGMGYRLRA